MNRLNLIVSVAAIALLGGIAAETISQAPPDFSGRWTIASAPAAPLPSPGGTAPAARPDQGTLAAGDLGSGWGSPLAITQDARQMIVEQTLFSRYDAMAPLRFVYTLDGSESRNDVMIGHSSQVRVSRGAWEGPVLRITTRYPGVDPGSGQAFTMEVVHRLSLESPTSLVVEVTRAAALGGKPSTTRTVYRKS